MRRAVRVAGYTMLELLIAMSVFVFLGTVLVFLMRQGLNVFATGARDANLQDRADVVLPRIVADFQLLALPASFDPPPRMPSEEERMAGREGQPPPPEDVRVRAGSVVMTDQGEGPLRDLPCPYVAFVMDISGDRTDPHLRRAGDRTGPDLKELTPAEAARAEPTTGFLPTSGLREVVYIAIAEDPDFPGILTLYRGWRSPIGGEGTLLDPANLNSLREVHERCRPVVPGLLHFGVTFRRVFSRDWEPSRGRVGETEGYVGPVWDSTRALDRSFALYRGPESLGDPSDDVFPAWVRLEVSLASPGTAGYGPGDTELSRYVDEGARALGVDNASPLFGGTRAPERFLKVGSEWMGYSIMTADARLRHVPVRRGLRGTKAVPHEDGSPVYIGLNSRRDVRLLFRDRYAAPRAEGVR